MNQTPVYTFAKWKVLEDQLDIVLRILAEAVEESTKEEGNIFYKVHQENANPTTLILWEGYTNEVALQAHRNSTHFKTLILDQIIPKLAEREVIVTSELEF